jgi:hypothetical protein
MTRDELKKINADNTPDQAREQLKSISPNLPDRCRGRMLEILTRRANGGEYSEKDVVFMADVKKAGNDKTKLEAVCKGSNNTAMGTLFAYLFLGGTAASVFIKNYFPPKRRIA